MSNQINTQFIDNSTLELRDIVIVHASISNPKSISSVEGSTINLDFGIDAAFNLDNKIIRLTFKCDLSTSTSNDVEGKFEIGFYFVVDEFDNLVNLNQEEKQVSMENDFLLSIANITYSTARGIIYSHCLGSVFNRLVIPVASNDTIKRAVLNSE